MKLKYLKSNVLRYKVKWGVTHGLLQTGTRYATPTLLGPSLSVSTGTSFCFTDCLLSHTFCPTVCYGIPRASFLTDK